MLSVGDKIEIKGIKKPKQAKDSFEQTFNDIIAILNSKLGQKDKLVWCETMFGVLEKWYVEDNIKSTRIAKNKLIPVLHKLVEKGSLENMASFFDFYRRAYIFCARRDFECFVDFMEWDQPKKVYAYRRDILKPYVDALNRIAFDDNLQFIIASFPPSYGKSYIVTLFEAWGLGLSIDNSFIRLSYSDELVLGFSRSVKSYVSSPQFAEVFTQYQIYEGRPFDVERESDWKIKNANVPKSNLISRTRSGSTTGERASFAIILDDMTKGAEEANSDAIHNSLWNKWLTEWWNRRDGPKCKFIFIGTQWCPEDILNRIIVDRDTIEPLKETSNPYVKENSSTIVIRVPMLDENGKTTCSEVYPQETAEQLRDTTDPFLFSCVYQQDPIAPTGREFAWECIRTYTELPDNLTENSFAALDTARKGKDNVAMPVVKSDNNGSYYLIDTLFVQKPMDDLYDDIVAMIIEHKITLLVIENNIDTSLKSLLEEKLYIKGIYFCEIREKYNTVKKEERIKNNRGIVQKQMVFPDRTIIKNNTHIGRLMDNVTKYSFDKPNVHDDGPDSICMIASEIILKNTNFGKVKPIKRIF